MASGLYFTLFYLSGGLWLGANVGPGFAKAQKLALNPISTHRVITCDDADNVQRLSCEIGVIDVESVMYGRTDHETCSEGRHKKQLMNTQCSQQGTLEVLKKRCDGLEACEINGNVVRTSDPCRGTYKYIDTTYSCVSPVHSVTCEHSLAYLQCDKGHVLYVISADYGRSDSTTCSYQRPDSQLSDVDCSRTSDKVSASCNGKSSCTFEASNSVFGDPCGGTYKYLKVDYTCQPANGDDCPADWTGFKGRCLVFVNKDLDWTDAESYCLEKGGNLASFHSPEEYNLIRNLILKNDGSNKTSWVGGNDAVKDGVWMWSDGSKFDFINWASGEPNNYGGGESCMDINLRGEDYVNDEKCTSKLPFVCSKRA